MGNHRWGADQNIQFINEYRRHECLWDPKHPQYKNKFAREAAYKTMTQTMEIETMVDVVSKIRILRNTYNNEILKAKKSMDMATDKVYGSKIPWLSHLDFIKNIETDRTENSAPDNTPQTSTAEYKIQKCTIRPKPAAPPSKNKRKLEDPLIKGVSALEKVSTPKANMRSNDEFDLFGQTIAEQLRQLPLGIALETEGVLLATLRKQRVRLANEEARRSNTIQQEFVCKNECLDEEENWET